MNELYEVAVELAKFQKRKGIPKNDAKLIQKAFVDVAIDEVYE